MLDSWVFAQILIIAKFYCLWIFPSKKFFLKSSNLELRILKGTFCWKKFLMISVTPKMALLFYFKLEKVAFFKYYTFELPMSSFVFPALMSNPSEIRERNLRRTIVWCFANKTDNVNRKFRCTASEK